MGKISRTALILHGVPEGQDFALSKDFPKEKMDFAKKMASYCYAHRNEWHDQWVVEANKPNQCMLYHYLKYDNVTGFQGRAGSYCGLTLYVEGGYPRFITWQILDTLRSMAAKHIFGHVLKSNKPHQFVIKDLSAALNKMSSEIDTMPFIKQIEVMNGTDAIADIYSWSPTNGKIVECHPSDLAETACEEWLRNGSEVHVSDRFPTHQSTETSLRDSLKKAEAAQTNLREEITKQKKQNADDKRTMNEERDKLMQEGRKQVLENIPQLTKSTNQLNNYLNNLKLDGRPRQDPSQPNNPIAPEKEVPSTRHLLFIIIALLLIPFFSSMFGKCSDAIHQQAKIEKTSASKHG